LDRQGTILRYNYAEAAFARRASRQTVGLGFFTDVAPCTNVQAFKGRFDRFASGLDSGADRFDFTFAFRWGSQAVSITLLRKAERDEINLIVRGRTTATLDIAEPECAAAVSPGALVPEEREHAADAADAGTHELTCATSWQHGSVAESAWCAKIHPDDAVARRRIVAAAAARRAPYAVEYRMLAANARQRIVVEQGTIAAGAGAAGSATIVDVTERRRQESELWKLAHYDSLTGLPNRGLLLQRIGSAVHEALSSGRVAAVVALALSDFEALQGSFGRATGDDLLRLVGLRLGESVRGGDTVAHLDGETFVVLLTDLDDVASAARGGARILETVSQPFALAGRSHRLAASMGISVAPRNGADSAALLHAAETALLVSRNGRRHAIEWYSSDIAAALQKDLHVEDELRLALERDEFVLYYQPIVDAATNDVVAAEALVRWNHPTRGLVMPGDFIAIAERSGLIAQLGNWVLRSACRQTREWLDAGFALHVCVNVSSVQFRERTFVESVAAILAEAAVPAKAIELELTESVMVDGFADVIDTLAKLKLIGVRLAIDDFGTGYSSLSYLKYFPIDTLKLDRAFVADITKDTFDRAIAKAVLTLANELELDCIAEGIEDTEQLALLRTLGCRLMQGYFFARPESASALTERLKRAAPGVAFAPAVNLS